ncbi:MAG: hypothetical protein GX228_06490 [Firmicutes bacterium]|nr:hypothetical protein [Bacillota bacterium]
MKKHLMLLLLLIVAISICSESIAIAATGLEGKEIVAENQYLVLYFNKEDTSIAVQCKETGRVWLSNPVGPGVTQPMQRSQINLVHDPGRVTKDNYTYSNSFERFEISPIDNGVRIDYQFVEKWTPGDYLPQLISRDRLEELILNKLGNKDRDTIRSYYYLIRLRKLDEGEEHPDIMGLPSEEIFGEYTLEILEDDFLELQAEVEALKSELQELELRISQSGSEDEALLAQKKKLESNIDKLSQSLLWDTEDITWHLINTILDNRADLSGIQYITFADVEQLVDHDTYLRKSVPRAVVNRLSEVVESTGYSPLDATDDHIANNINPSVPNLEIFEVAVEYQLDQDSLLVSVPVDDVKYPIDVVDFAGVEHTFPILFVEILPYFSAAGLEDEGYILIPDGSGALIYLNNGKTWTPTYNQGVYGRDNSEDPLSYITTYGQQIHLPVFGLKKGDQAYLGIIERGDSIAHLRADVSGKRDDFNRIFPRFNIIKSGSINLEHGGQLDVYQPEMFKGKVQVRYLFFVGEDANYSGMARRYQEYLIKTGVLKTAAQKQPPLLVELIGAFPRVEVHWGIPRTVAYPATTFAEAKDIFDDLSGMGIENIHIRYRGWLKGGLEHVYPRRAVIERNLGTETEFEELIDHVQENNGVVYPDVGFLNVYRNRLFDGFSSTRDAARRLNRLPAQINSYHLATFAARSDESAYLVSPRVLPGLVKSFVEDFNRFGSKGISLGQLGSQLNSDFNRTKGLFVDRQQAAEITADLMNGIAQEYSILVEKGNLYCLPYTSTIVNMPLEDSDLDIVDARIPFFQMVVSGYLTYAGDPVNQVADRGSYMLKSLEAGALPYFVLAAAESQVIKGTKYDQFLSFNYEQWRDTVLEYYEEYYPIYQKIYGHRLVEHQLIQDGVAKSTFDNGISIIVNYNHYPVELEGVTIAAQGYCLLEEDR